MKDVGSAVLEVRRTDSFSLFSVFLFFVGDSTFSPSPFEGLPLMRSAGKWCAGLIAAALLGLGDGFAVFAGAPRLVQSTRIRGSALWPCAMGMEISALRTADLLPAAQLLLDAFTERDDDKVNALSRPLIFAEHILGLSQRRHQNVLLACRVDQDVIGLVEMYTPEFLASQIPDVPPQYSIKMLRPYIANLAVRSAARKQGVASALIQRCEEKAREAGQDKITLQV